jgi:hypothetical protein
MTDITWFKLYHEALDDPKFLGIADRIMSRPGDVFHVFLKLLKRASENDERGSIGGFDEWGEAAWLRITVEEVRRIIGAIRDIGMITGDQITRWAKRQGAAAAKLARATISAGAERTRRYRARKAAAAKEPELPFGSPAEESVTVTIEASLGASHSPVDRESDQERIPPGPPNGGRATVPIFGKPRQGEILMPIRGGRQDGRRRETARERRDREWKEGLAAIVLARRMARDGVAAGAGG